MDDNMEETPHPPINNEETTPPSASSFAPARRATRARTASSEAREMATEAPQARAENCRLECVMFGQNYSDAPQTSVEGESQADNAKHVPAVHEKEFLIEKILDHGICDDPDLPTASVGQPVYRVC